MKLEGCVYDIKFRNDENGYTVFSLEQDDDKLITVVGKFPEMSVGQNLLLEGEYVFNAKFGKQFSAEKCTFVEPTSLEGIYKYLCSGLIKGVGPITAQNIVNAFKEETLYIIEYNPMKLSEVRGISINKANAIAQSYKDIKQMQNTIIFLQNYEITTNMAVKIYKQYGDKVKEIMETNPYKLIEDVDGIGFSTADKIALKMGILPDSEFRLRAGLYHILKDSAEKSGNTYIPYESAISSLYNLLKLDNEDEEKLEKVIFELAIDDVIKILTIDDKNSQKALMLSSLYYTERNIATKIFQLLNSNSLPFIDVTKEIEFYEEINKITLHENQKQAVAMGINNNISVITGGPGTGKTTIIKCIISILKGQGKKFILMAPTGRAAKKMSESTGEEAKTIHRALDLDFKNGRGIFFSYNESNPLPFDTIIVDEVSMIDVFLMNSLLKAIKRTAQIILVGDKNQLPSVGAGNVLADILASKVVNVATLTEIYRQDAKSLIISNAHAINKGVMPVLDNSSNDFYFVKKEEQQDILEAILQLQSQRLPKYYNIEPLKIQVIAPLKQGLCGIDNLNRKLQEVINPKSDFKTEIVTENIIYRLGDKVMQISNNYEQEWTKYENGFYEEGLGVFNGDIGTIEFIDISTQEVVVNFDDGRTTRYNKSNLNELVLAYAITIHKSQGSEFDIVVMPAILGANSILTRNLLYTAVTRAKKCVVIVGTKFAISRMVANNYTLERFTTLKKLLLGYSSDKYEN